MGGSSAPATFTEYWDIVLARFNVSVRRVGDVTALSRMHTWLWSLPEGEAAADAPYAAH